MDELQRQFRIALIAVLIIIPVAVIGFMHFEGYSPLDAIWVTIITLTTIGYGDITAKTIEGRIFTLFVILFGMGALLFAIQSSFGLFASPTLRDLRQRRRTQRIIDKLSQHYIICGKGELVDKTINYLLQRSQTQTNTQHHQRYNILLDRLFGQNSHSTIRKISQTLFERIFHLLIRGNSFLDLVVIITQDKTYAERLREKDFLVIEGDPTDEHILTRAGIKKAKGLMVLLDSDTEALLTTLTASKLNTQLYITAAALEERVLEKLEQVGAHSVIAPFEVAGQFLNNATLRPAVNMYFNNLLFSDTQHSQVVQLHLWDDSPWIGKHLGTLKLRERFDSGIIGIRKEDGDYEYAPSQDRILLKNEVLLAVCPMRQQSALLADCRAGTEERFRPPAEQVLMTPSAPPTSQKRYTLEEAGEAINAMSQHFIICGTSRVARNAIKKLNPERPFVIISDDLSYTQELLARGFRVVHGAPTLEETLHKAGISRAQAIMIALDDRAASVLSVLSCRVLSKRLLITATANSDDMIDKLMRAGADSVVSPFHVAAQFVLLASIQPETSHFMKHVLFNYETGLETTELYMETDSPWIGETIESLRIDRLFRAGVIGIRLADRQTYIYAPPSDYVIGANEVLIVVVPMIYSDELASSAHGSISKRPTTLRSKVLTSGSWSRDMIKDLIEQGSKTN